MNIEIKHRFTEKVLLSGKYESIKDCLEKNGDAYLRGAYLGDADLGGAYLRGADLRGAYLRGADLRGANGYSESHTFFQEVIRQQKVDTFTPTEWSIIGQIIIHTLCWDSIKKRFNKSAMKIFKKLSKVGFEEWAEKYKEAK